MPAFPPGMLLPLLPLLPGLLFFPALFLLARAAFRRIGGAARDNDTVLAARLVSSIQAVMASTAGYVIASSCPHVIDDTHWLASAYPPFAVPYPPFAVPYFVYDVYAMYLCHLRRPQLKGHARPAPGAAAAAAFLRKDLLMVLHHLAMVLVCFPVATVRHLGTPGASNTHLGTPGGTWAHLGTPGHTWGALRGDLGAPPGHGARLLPRGHRELTW
ncbi:ceramide synthase-like, partial [Myiozetetes cayanensis]|uniref:ceramide synthase-like n=1 Tax=Myiozetetes cayanensis TaxID=478635 RepID=UPI00215E9328